MPEPARRATEYRLMIEEILENDRLLRERGLPGLEDYERLELRDMIARAMRKARAGAASSEVA